MPIGDLIQQSYRYELAPTAAQAKLLASFTGASRFWFSTGLALVKVRLDQRAREPSHRHPLVLQVAVLGDRPAQGRDLPLAR